MSAYDIEWTSAAQRQLKALAKANPQGATAITRAVGNLASTPLPRGVKALQPPYRGQYRIDVKGQWGSFRVRYTVDHKKVEVEVVALGDRRDIY